MTVYQIPTYPACKLPDYWSQAISLIPSSGERVFLWPVRVLLFNGEPSVRSATCTGGIPGCHATRPHPCSPQVLEVAMETILQPHQAGTVGACLINEALSQSLSYLSVWAIRGVQAWISAEYQYIELIMNSSSVIITKNKVTSVVFYTSLLREK